MGGFEGSDWVAVREQVIVMGAVVGIAQKVAFGEDIAAVDVEGAGRSWLAADGDRKEADSLALADDQDQIGTHPEAGGIANISVQNKKVQQSETWAALEQVVGYKVSVEASVLRLDLDSDVMGLGSDDVGRAARTFGVMDHYHFEAVGLVDVGKDGVGESVQTDSAVKTDMSWVRMY